MKKALKFAGIVACVLALVAFILLMATVGFYAKSGSLRVDTEGIKVLFGEKGNYVDTKLAWSGLLAWIFIILAMIILALGFILPLVKVKALDKYAGILNLVAVALLVVAGIFIFISPAVFNSANGGDSDSLKYAHLGEGWIVAGILAILGGAVAICPAVVDFIGKKK